MKWVTVLGREAVSPKEEEEEEGGRRGEVCGDKEKLARCTESQSALVMTTAPCR